MDPVRRAMHWDGGTPHVPGTLVQLQGDRKVSKARAPWEPRPSREALAAHWYVAQLREVSDSVSSFHWRVQNESKN